MFKTATQEGRLPALEGVTRQTLVYGEKTLMVEFRLDKGSALPVHDHPYEQIGYLVSGHLELTIGEEARRLGAGDSWCIPSNAPHNATALEDSVAVEVFAPVREDYLP